VYVHLEVHALHGGGMQAAQCVVRAAGQAGRLVLYHESALAGVPMSDTHCRLSIHYCSCGDRSKKCALRFAVVVGVLVEWWSLPRQRRSGSQCCERAGACWVLQFGMGLQTNRLTPLSVMRCAVHAFDLHVRGCMINIAGRGRCALNNAVRHCMGCPSHHCTDYTFHTQHDTLQHKSVPHKLYDDALQYGILD
jgi:hypothetical protein